MEKFKKIPTWAIVLAFIFMWPVGIVLLVLKYSGKDDANYEKVLTNANRNGVSMIKKENTKLEKLKKKRKRFKVYTIIQVIIAIVFFFSFIVDIAEEDDNLEGAILVNVIAFGILVPCCITYFKTNTLIKKIETYQNLILIRDMYDTQKLAQYLNCPRNEVLDFVTYMIREGYLELEIKNDNLAKPKEYIDPAQMFSIVCQNCGATNKYIKGKNNKCEYCGSILNLEKI